MALVSTGFYANFVLIDAGGNKSNMRFKLTSADIETAVTDAGTLATRLDAITEAVILNYSVGEMYEENSSFLAVAGVQIENVALIVAKIDDAEEKWAQLRIPAPVAGLFLAATGKNSNIVDPTDADLVAYLNSFQSAGFCEISDGEHLLSPGTAGNVSGKRIHRASRKG